MTKETIEKILGRSQHEYLLNIENDIDFSNKRILVTGANGSIGTRLCERLKALNVNILPTDIEGHTYPLDVTNTDSIIKAMIYYKPTDIINIAGAKHAPEGEVNPFEVCNINTIGTHNLLTYGNARITLASTCKSCDPETAYGASKLIAERMVLNANGGVARFFNVIETQGNVFEIWETQKVKEVTTCYRFFISLDEAVGLTLHALINTGRFIVNTNRKYMPFVYEALYPNNKAKIVGRRRGDREEEPFIAKSEKEQAVNKAVFKITNYHDRNN
jgi:FlaA1/EpsC-like NDP-sugar epimerase